MKVVIFCCFFILVNCSNIRHKRQLDCASIESAIVLIENEIAMISVFFSGTVNDTLSPLFANLTSLQNQFINNLCEPTITTTTIATTSTSPLNACDFIVNLTDSSENYLKTLCWVTTAMTYSTAENFCKAHNMNLFAVTSSDIFTALNDWASGYFQKPTNVFLNGKQDSNGTWYVYNPDKSPLFSAAVPTNTSNEIFIYLRYNNFGESFTTATSEGQLPMPFFCEYSKSAVDASTTSTESTSTTSTIESSSTTSTTAMASTTTAKITTCLKCPFIVLNLGICVFGSPDDCTCSSGTKHKCATIIFGSCCN